MGKFLDFKKKNSKYIVLYPEDSINVTYKGEESAVEGINKFGSKCMIFEFGTNDGDKKFEITNMWVIAQFENYKPGDKLTIRRSPKGTRPSLVVTKEGEESAPF